MTNHNDSQSSLPRLNLPRADLKLSFDEQGCKVWDPLRKKYVMLTPEEFVRQNFTSWLMGSLNYPPSVMANEIGIRLNGTLRRCDTVVFDPDGSPLMIVEYKAPTINVTQDVFDQIVRYNMVLHAKYLIVSNGLRHFCCRIDYNHDTYHFLPRIPDYAEMRWGTREN